MLLKLNAFGRTKNNPIHTEPFYQELAEKSSIKNDCSLLSASPNPQHSPAVSSATSVASSERERDLIRSFRGLCQEGKRDVGPWWGGWLHVCDWLLKLTCSPTRILKVSVELQKLFGFCILYKLIILLAIHVNVCILWQAIVLICFQPLQASLKWYCHLDHVGQNAEVSLQNNPSDPPPLYLLCLYSFTAISFITVGIKFSSISDQGSGDMTPSIMWQCSSLANHLLFWSFVTEELVTCTQFSKVLSCVKGYKSGTIVRKKINSVWPA